MMMITKEIENAFAKQGDTSQKEPKDIRVVCKFFGGPATWYVYDRYDGDPDIFWCFANLGDPSLAELGTVSLAELQSIRWPIIERDRWFKPLSMSLQEVMDIVRSSGHV